MDQFTKVPNDILEALARADFCGSDRRIIDVILRRVQGWNKMNDWISCKQFSVATGLKRSNVHRSLKLLELNQVVVIHRDDKRRPKYSINKEILKWKVLSMRITRAGVIQADDKLSSKRMTGASSRGMTKVLSTGRPTKETLKETFKERPKESTHPRPQGPSGGDSNNQGNIRKGLFAEYLEAKAQSRVDLSYVGWINSLSAPER